MKLNQQIQNCIENLPASYEQEILDFLAQLLAKAKREEEIEWSGISLSSAMRGMESELPDYSEADLKVAYR